MKKLTFDERIVKLYPFFYEIFSVRSESPVRRLSLDFFQKPAQNKVYTSFKQYLGSCGFTIYPWEFDCISSKHPLVDLAAKMGSFYWAFEYKSETDSISRGVEQVRAYSEWFDYVVLVSEKHVDHTRSDLFWDLKSLGAGIWNYWPSSGKCVRQMNPTLLAPEKWKRKHVNLRFKALGRKKKKNNLNSKIADEFGVQSSLFDFCGPSFDWNVLTN